MPLYPPVVVVLDVGIPLYPPVVVLAAGFAAEGFAAAGLDHTVLRPLGPTAIIYLISVTSVHL